MSQNSRKTCYLCMEMTWCKDKVPRFSGYRTFSSEPWHLTSTGGKEFYTILYQTTGEDFQEAMDEMTKTVEVLAERMPGSFWKSVWPWVNPDRESHDARYEMRKELMEDMKPHL